MIISLRRLALFGIISLALGSGASFAETFMVGDVFVSVTTPTDGAQVWWYRSDGTLVAKLSTGFTFGSGITSGSSTQDAAGNLYVADFNANTVSKFDTSGNLLGTFGSGYNSNPESIVFDSAGNVYVGQANGLHQVLEFNSSGTLLNTFSPAIEDQGTDWIDLASDQHTIYYTSEGTTVKRFDTSTNAQLPDFATGLPGTSAFALRLLPTGGLLVADTDRVLRLDSSGNIAQTYTIAGAKLLFALNLDPDGTSFWTGDNLNGDLYKVNIITGAVEQTIATGTSGGDVNGVSLLGGIPASAVPEPSQLAVTLALCGLLLAWRSWRKSQTGGNS